VVIDPMCGGGSISIEVRASYQIKGDVDVFNPGCYQLAAMLPSCWRPA